MNFHISRADTSTALLRLQCCLPLLLLISQGLHTQWFAANAYAVLAGDACAWCACQMAAVAAAPAAGVPQQRHQRALVAVAQLPQG